MRRPEIVNKILKLWHRWTEPVPTILDVQQRQQSRLLASILLGVAVVGTPIALLPNLLDSTVPLVNASTVSSAVNISLLFVTLWVARRGYYQVAAILIAVFGSLTLLLGALLNGGEVGLQFLYFLCIVIVFSGLFLNVQTTFALFVFQLGIMIVFGWLEPTISLSQILLRPFVFYISMTTVTLVIIYHRNRWDREQRARLIESEQRHRVIADMLADYAYVLQVESNGNLQQVWLSESAQQLPEMGINPTRLQDTIEFFHPDDQERARRHFEDMLVGTIQRDELRFIFKGTAHWLRLSHLPAEAGGRVRTIYGTVQIITSQKMAQQQQFEAALARERYDLVHGFFRAVSHDFRTSLSVIKTNQYLIQMLVKRGDYDQIENRLQQTDQQVDRLTRQLENLKLVSALNSPTKTCNPNDLMQAEVAEQRDAIAAKSLNVTFTPDPDAPMIAVNPDEMRRAVGHLLENAIRFTSPGGSVQTGVKHQSQQVLFEVTDTGPGIAVAEQEQIFEFFYRGDEARSIESGGIGLGLSIAKIVAEAYGGQLSVESEPGHGSTFMLSIPSEE